MPRQRIVIDPVTRIEGHAKISLHLDEQGRVEEAYFHVTPLFARPSWSGYETDSALHTSYWISEWPRVPVGPGFLMPLLLQTRARMSVSVCMVPIDPIQARRRLQAQRTAHPAPATRPP